MKLFNRIVKAFLIIFIPFILIDVGWFLSFMSFDIKAVYNSIPFWTIVIIYWIITGIIAFAIRIEELY